MSIATKLRLKEIRHCFFFFCNCGCVWFYGFLQTYPSKFVNVNPISFLWINCLITWNSFLSITKENLLLVTYSQFSDNDSGYLSILSHVGTPLTFPSCRYTSPPVHPGHFNISASFIYPSSGTVHYHCLQHCIIIFINIQLSF